MADSHPAAVGRCAFWRARLLLTWIAVLSLKSDPLLSQEVRARTRPVGIDVSLVAAKKLAGAREFIAQGDWESAVAALDRLHREHGAALVEMEPGRYWNVAESASAIVSRMPADGLAAYRARIDPLIKPVYEDALRRGDPQDMQLVLRDGFASSYGDDALWWLAEYAWEHGDLDAARVWWTAMLPLSQAADEPPLVLRYPDAEYEPSAIRARLVLCSILQVDHRQATNELESFEHLHPGAEGHLAGVDGVYSDTLSKLAESTRRHSDSAVHQPLQFESVAVSGISTLRWSVELPESGLPIVERGKPALPRLDPLACIPVRWNDSVLVTNGRTVRAFRLTDGSPVWPIEDANRTGVIYTDPAHDWQPDLATAGLPRFTAQVSEGRYFARMGPPVVVPAVRSLGVPPSRIVCLDLAGAEGRLAWSAAPDETLSTRGWVFSGAPLVVGDMLYVPLRRTSPQMEVGLACLSSRTGRFVWETLVSGDVAERPQTHHLVYEEQLAFGHGLVLRSGGSGTVAAVDAATGEIRWITTYRQSAVSTADLSNEHHRQRAAPVFDRGKFFLAPHDSRELLAVDSVSGVVVWSRKEPGRIRNLVGVEDGLLIAVGDQLWGFDANTGAVQWTVGFSDPQGFGYGNAVLADGHVFWTTHEELLCVEIESGRLVRRVPLNALDGTTGGNVAAAGEMLLIAQPRRLTAFGPPRTQEK